MEDLQIERTVRRGHMRQFDLHIAKLPTGTVVNIHIFVYRGKKDGPVLLLTGGLHGDEVNGVEIIRRMMQDDVIRPYEGTVIAIPVLNIYGFLNFARDLPDGKDANRSFPGTKNGSLASRVAYYMRKKILPLVDFGVDFHTGGGNKNNYPQIRCDFDDEIGLKLAHFFHPPFIIHSAPIPQSLRNEARSQGKRLIVYEGGQSLRFDEFAIQEGINGTVRLMHELGMTRKRKMKGKAWKPVTLSTTTWVRAENAGLFHYNVKPGSKVETGELLGTITDPYNEYEVNITSPQSGYIIGLNHSPVINAGDALFHIDCEDGRAGEPIGLDILLKEDAD